ncbi:MAG: DPP IV N-terminal domain-containing protein, partial [Anaerolineales bacterium]|nr:DPP IV N-terminal domain-containing protein [Anaerolineales bacterium]
MINTKKEFAPYGQWSSRITPEMTGSLLEISQPAWSADGTLFWWERFSTKASINSRNPETGEIVSLTGDHQPGGELMYGGGAFGLSNNALYFIDKITHQLFRTNLLEASSTPLTSTLINAGSPTLSPKGDFVIFVHSNGESDGIFIQVLDSQQGPSPLVTRSDFFNYPRWHPDGRQITWISWDHPHMPWDSSSLWLGSIEINQGEKPRLVDKTLIAGGAGIAVLQPEFSPDGRYLAYISDQDGWWQLYLVDLSTGNHQQLTNVPCEHGLPPWLQNQKSYGFSPDGDRIYFLRNQEGFRSLWCLDLKKGTENQIQLDENYSWLDELVVSPREDKIALVASSGDSPPRLITILPDGKTELIRLSSTDPLPCNIFSLPRAISWKSDGEHKIQGLFYAPENPCFVGTGKPPLLVNIHSGPTRQKWAEFQPRTQYFTSRGFAVLEVNYRGSSGYGRDYRQA